MKFRSPLTLLLIFVLSGHFLQVLDAHEFIPLGGGESQAVKSVATALSGDGTTVVGQSGEHHAFLWTEPDGFQQLLTGPTFTGLDSAATDVSGDGSVVAGTVTQGEITEAFYWSLSDGGSLLGQLDADIKNFATSLEHDGTSLYGQSESVEGSLRPFKWTAAGGFEPFENFVKDITPDGSVRIGSLVQSGNEEGYRWQESIGLEGLGYLEDVTFSQPRAVSINGDVVVGVGYMDSQYQGFRWTKDIGMAVLGNLPANIFASAATATSPSGNVVFGQNSGRTIAGLFFSQFTSAFIWDSQNGMRELKEVLNQEYGLAAALENWSLQDVVGVSYDGRTIAGNGLNPHGISEAWIVRLDRSIDVPEPSAFVLTLLAIGTCLCWRQR